MSCSCILCIACSLGLYYFYCIAIENYYVACYRKLGIIVEVDCIAYYCIRLLKAVGTDCLSHSGITVSYFDCVCVFVNLSKSISFIITTTHTNADVQWQQTDVYVSVSLSVCLYVCLSVCLSVNGGVFT